MSRMLADVGFTLLMLVVLIAARLLGQRSGLPYSVLLTVVGLLYALLPGPNLHLDPEFVLDVVVPPLLYTAALDSSLLALRRTVRSIVELSVVLVLLTSVAVGAAMSAIIPGVSIALGLAFGAAVAPPDPVASLSIGRRAGLPPKLITLIEGEGLLNDATALTLYQVAIASAVAGSSFSVPDAIGQLLLHAVGGIAVGAALAIVLRLLRRFLRDALVANAVSLATPFAAYAGGEAIGVSGVLAVVVAGLMIGHTAPRSASGAGRLQTSAVWRLVDFLLEGFVFLLIGEQLPTVISGLNAYRTSTIVTAAAASVGIVLLIRPLFLAITNVTPRFLNARLGTTRRPLATGELVAISWAGTRGVITLAITFALPLTTHTGADLPGRDLLLFCAYLVVLVTLVGQGVTFAALLRRLGIVVNPLDAARQRNEARAAAVRSALAKLDDVAEDDNVPAQVVADLRGQLESQQRRYLARLDAFDGDEDQLPQLSATYLAAVGARRAIIDAQREELLRWRDAGRLSDSMLRSLQTELDLQERILPD